ncbi:MAG: hypothetical protein Q9187_000606 [Circinaria calcarea]
MPETLTMMTSNIETLREWYFDLSRSADPDDPSAWHASKNAEAQTHIALKEQKLNKKNIEANKKAEENSLRNSEQKGNKAVKKEENDAGLIERANMHEPVTREISNSHPDEAASLRDQRAITISRKCAASAELPYGSNSNQLKSVSMQIVGLQEKYEMKLQEHFALSEAEDETRCSEQEGEGLVKGEVLRGQGKSL